MDFRTHLDTSLMEAPIDAKVKKVKAKLVRAFREIDDLLDELNDDTAIKIIKLLTPAESAVGQIKASDFE